jgi:hypothetical protein
MYLRASSGTDARQNQDETDVDCGGGLCRGCVIDQRCELPSDCALGACDEGVCTPAVGACQDLFRAPDRIAQLQWPLIAKDTGLRRPAIGTSFGELQEHQREPTYLHTGIDLRGVAGDRVKVVADGNIWLTANLSDCAESTGDECRLYIKDAAGRYIYYYSHLAFFHADPMSMALRTAIMNASPQGGGYEVRPNTAVVAGMPIASASSACAPSCTPTWLGTMKPAIAITIGSAENTSTSFHDSCTPSRWNATTICALIASRNSTLNRNASARRPGRRRSITSTLVSTSSPNWWLRSLRRTRLTR